MPTGTRAEFAAHRGVDKSTVTRWDQKGKLVWTEDRHIDFEASAALIEKTADPTMHGVTVHHAKQRVVKAIESALNESELPLAPSGIPAPQVPGASDATYSDFNRARADKEAELALIARMNREEKAGLLIRKDDVQRDIESLATVVSKGLTGIPARVMPLLNGEPDPGRREALLEEQIRVVLNEFAAKALALTEG